MSVTQQLWGNLHSFQTGGGEYVKKQKTKNVMNSGCITEPFYVSVSFVLFFFLSPISGEVIQEADGHLQEKKALLRGACLFRTLLIFIQPLRGLGVEKRNAEVM